jgi:hypothetical protein
VGPILVVAAVSGALSSTVSGAVSPRILGYPAAFFAAVQPTSALDMLTYLPCFTFDAGGGVRGFAVAGNVLVDGERPASKDDGLEDVLRRIPASSVLRIDVIFGGAPGIDMQGKTVLANIVTRHDIAGKVTINASTTHGLDNQAGGNILVQAERRSGDTSFEGSLRAAKYLDNGAGAGTWVRAGGTGAEMFQAHELSRGAEETYKATGAAETPALGGKLHLNASITIEPYQLHQDDTLVPAPGAEDDRSGVGQDSAEFGVRYERDLRPGVKLESFLLQRLGRQTNTDDFLSNPQTASLTGDDVSASFRLRKTTSETIARTNVTVPANRTLSIQVSGEGDYNTLQSNTRYVENGALTPLPAADVDVDELRGELLVNATWQAVPSLTAESGLRAEASRISSSGDITSGRSLFFPKPRLALTFSPRASDQFRIRVEREVGQLDFNDFTAQTAGLNTGTVHAGNPTLDPGEDWVAEGAWDRRFWRTADLTFTVRRYWLSNVVDRVGVASPSGVYDSPGNIGAGTKDEASVALSLPLDPLGVAHGLLTGEATLRESRVTDPTVHRVRSISGLHRSDWTLHFTQGMPRWRASWGCDLYGPWTQSYYRFDEIDADKLKMYVGLFADYKPRGDLTFRIEAINAFGQGIEHSRVVFDGPRNAAGVDFTDVHQLRVGHFLRLKLTKSFQ